MAAVTRIECQKDTANQLCKVPNTSRENLGKTWAKNRPRIRDFEAGHGGKRNGISET